MNIYNLYNKIGQIIYICIQTYLLKYNTNIDIYFLFIFKIINA